MWGSLDSVGLLVHSVSLFQRVRLIFPILIASHSYQLASRERSTRSVSLSGGSIAACLRRPAPLLKSLETTCTSISSLVAVVENFFLGFQRSHALWHLTLLCDWLDMDWSQSNLRDFTWNHHQDAAKTSRFAILFLFLFTQLMRAAMTSHWWILLIV